MSGYRCAQFSGTESPEAVLSKNKGKGGTVRRVYKIDECVAYIALVNKVHRHVKKVILACET
jgi:hypothetical protein